jgi:quercetin dioxygenase-like cupin family protein
MYAPRSLEPSSTTATHSPRSEKASSSTGLSWVGHPRFGQLYRPSTGGATAVLRAASSAMLDSVGRAQVRQRVVGIGTEIESPQTGERVIFRSTEDSSDGEPFQAESIMRPRSYLVRSHVHPRQEERFVVLEGRFGYQIGDHEGVGRPGETLVCRSRCRTASGTRRWVMRILYERRPALTSAEIFFKTSAGACSDAQVP